MNNNKQLLKATIIIVLIALLLIPTWFITQLVNERKVRKQEITKQVYNSWASAQIVSTPYLQVFYNKNTNTGEKSTITSRGYIMPNSSIINTIITPQNLKRSIYNIPVYESSFEMNGVFAKTDWEKFKSSYGEVTTMNSFLALNITDTRGIVDSATITVGNNTQQLQVTPLPTSTGMKCVTISLQNIPNIGITDVTYKINFTIKGTEKLSFIPLAANNTINIKSSWKDPSFEGSFATHHKTITNKGFEATWKINGNSLSIPTINDTWIDTTNIITGVNLINNIDSYAKTLRCTKYALLFIALTFALFYFIELLKNTQIHPVQYVLVGLALVIFYTLLLSISEYIDFNIAYSIASIATLLLISYYATSVMKSSKNGLLIGTVLLGLYVFMYVVIQLEETSLLVGSIGLFVLLAIIMQVSKKINWSAISLFNNDKK